MNGIAHLGNGTVIENSAIGFEKGKITFVADATTIRLSMMGAKVIHIYGKHVYPGLIACNTDLGLREIEAVRATNDNREVGLFNPAIRSITAYNTDSKVIPTIRSNGILLAQIIPSGGIISGSSSVVQLDAWNYEDAAYKTDIGIHLNWPKYYKANYDFEKGSGSLGVNEDYSKQIDEIKNYFLQAKAYAQGPRDESNMQLNAMIDLFNGKKKLFINADLESEIMNAVLFGKEINVSVVIVGGDESFKCAKFLHDNNIPVILHRIQSLPNSDDADYDQPYKTPAVLQQAGVLYCMSQNDFWQQRNLSFNAAQGVPYGISKEQALSAITKNAAMILGIGDITGILQSGYDANIIVSDGDILDVKSNNIIYAFIQGRMISLDNSQKDLYELYLKKYGLKE